MKEKLGATGKFPRGKIYNDDEGELRLAVAADPANGVIKIYFGKPVAWIGLPVAEAQAFVDSVQGKIYMLTGERG